MLIKTVTRLFPTENVVGIHLKLEDDNRPDLGAGTHIVIDRDFTEVFTPGAGMAVAVRNSVGQKAQAAIDAYKKAKALFNEAAYQMVVNQINSNLNITE